jgi:hypothetical protein
MEEELGKRVGTNQFTKREGIEGWKNFHHLSKKENPATWWPNGLGGSKKEGPKDIPTLSEVGIDYKLSSRAQKGVT